jgi:hypothetical protein
MLVARDIGDDIMDDIARDIRGDDAGDRLRWLTYAELGKAMRIKPASARRLAQRKPWLRKPNNRGEAMIGVPLDALPPQSVAPDTARDIGEDITRDTAPDVAPDALFVLATLGQHIARLEADLASLKTENTVLRDRVGQADVRVAVLETERAMSREALDDARRALAAALARPASVPTIIAPARRSWRWPFRRRA